MGLVLALALACGSDPTEAARVSGAIVYHGEVVGIGRTVDVELTLANPADRTMYVFLALDGTETPDLPGEVDVLQTESHICPTAAWFGSADGSWLFWAVRPSGEIRERCRLVVRRADAQAHFIVASAVHVGGEDAGSLVRQSRGWPRGDHREENFVANDVYMFDVPYGAPPPPKEE